MRLLLKEDSKARKVKYSPRLPDKYRFEEKEHLSFFEKIELLKDVRWLVLYFLKHDSPNMRYTGEKSEYINQLMDGTANYMIDEEVVEELEKMLKLFELWITEMIECGHIGYPKDKFREH